MKFLRPGVYIPGRVAVICTGAFLLVAFLTALSDILRVPVLVANALNTSEKWTHPALDAFFVLIVGAFATYLVSNLVLRQTQMAEELKLRAQLLDAANDSIFLYRPDGSFVYANEVAYKSRGYSREQLMAMNRRDLSAPEFAEAFDSLVKEIVDKGEVDFESVHLRKDGTSMPVEIHARHIRMGDANFILSVCRDIARHKLAQEALKLQEAYFQQLFDNSPDAIVMLDNTDRVLQVNKGFETLFGYRAEEIKGRFINELIIPDDRVEESSALSRTALNGEAVRKETVRKRKDGSLVDVSAVGYPIHFGDKLVGVYVIYSDITERKRVEARIRESEQQYRLLAENVTDVIWTTSVGSPDRLTYISPSVIRLLGYSIEEAMSKRMGEIFTPASFENAMKAFAEEMTTEEQKGREPFRGRTLELELERKDGSTVPVEVNYSFIRGAGGRSVEILAVARDITERKQVEELYSTLVNSSPASIYIGQDDKFTYVNPAFQEASGYTEDELLVRDLSTIVHPDDRESVRQHVVQMLKGERLQPYEFRFITKSGETGWALERVTSITYAGRPAILGVCINITEHKQAEEALRQSEGKYAALVEKGNDGIIIIQDGVLMFVNSKMLEMTGFSMNEALGRAFLDFVSPESRGLVAERYRRRIAGESVSDRYEIAVLSRDGEKIPVDISASIIEYEGRSADMAIIRDVSDRKQAEEALKDSRRRFRDMVNLLPQSVWETDTEGYVTFLNRQGILSFGYGLDEVKEPFNVALAYVPEDRDRMKENTQRVLNGEKLGGTEYTALRRDGSTFPVIVYAVPIIQGNKAVGLRGVTIDISERKQAEELYRTLANSSPVGVYIVQDKKFVFTNPAFRRSMGFTADELLGMDPSTVIRPDDRESVRQSAVQMLKGKRFQPYEFRFITKSGETRWALDRVTSITYQGKQATLGNFMDITESKQAQERIEHAAEEWRTTFDSITDFISIHDKDNRLVRMNKALADAFKTTPKELIGKVCHEVMHGTKEPPANCPYRQTLRTGKPATMEMFEPSLGIWLQESASPIFDAKGEVTGSVHIVRDVSERKRMEEQLVMTDRLASIGELASGIAHELNNPLTSVIGFSQLLMEGNIPDNIKEDLGTVYSEAQRAATIVKNLLTFARKHASVKQLSQVNAIIEDVLRLRAYEQKVNNIEVDKRLATDLPEIMVDYFQMQQAFLNIIVNAESVMLEAHGKGKLAITTERVNGGIKVTFTDDGPGITKENMKRIFAPFFTTKEVGKGTGLGLSICHGIVSGHGGRIYAESEFGQGATFVVELPLNGN